MIKLTTGKCWQSGHGAIVFQCSTHDGTTRHKGFLELNAAKPNAPVTFSFEKPSGELAAKGVANLVRKYLDSGSLTALALSPPDVDEEFLRLTFNGKTSAGNPSQIMLVIATHPDREITLIADKKSLARLRETSTFTVAKPAPAIFYAAEDLPGEGFQSWLMTCFASNHPQNGLLSTKDSAANSSPPLRPQLLAPWRRDARERVARRIKTLKKTLTQDQSKIPSPSDLLRAQKEAELLRSFLWLVKPESIELRLDATQTGAEARVIPLDPDKTPGANLEAVFKKIKKIERAIAIGIPRIKDIAQSIQRFEQALETLKNPEIQLTEDQVRAILGDIGLERTATMTPPSRSSQIKITAPGRKFQSADGHTILIGRSAEESDKLVKIARSQDWWLHVAGGGHGGHVIINGNQFRSGLPQNLLREAAILALHFSDRAASREGEVYVARRHQIKKRKGMPPGLWQIDRAEALLIRYEANELKEIFAREVREGVQRRHEPGTEKNPKE